MNQICNYCQSLNFCLEATSGEFTLCCQKGKVHLPSFEDYPQELRLLLNRSHTDSCHFLDNIRNYNSSLAFASTKVNMQEKGLNSHGPYFFRVQGQAYHLTFSKMDEQQTAKYSQLYMLDTKEALDIRMNNVNKMPKQLRHLFCTLCLWNQISEPLLLFNQYVHDFIEEFSINDSFEIAKNKCLIEFEKIFKDNGKTCSEFDLPSPNFIDYDVENYSVEEEKIIGDEMYSKLNNEQLFVVRSIMESINSTEERSKCFFIDGPGNKIIKFTLYIYILKKINLFENYQNNRRYRKNIHLQ